MSLLNFFKNFNERKHLPQKCKEDKEHIGPLLELPYRFIYPYELLEGFCIAISINTLKPPSLSTKDIKLYALYNKEDNVFLGSCYAVKFNELFYAMLIGTKGIFSFKPDSFVLKETIELLAPIKSDDNFRYFISCKFDAENEDIEAKVIKKLSKEDPLDENIIYTFSQGIDFDRAIEIASCYLAEN